MGALDNDAVSLCSGNDWTASGRRAPVASGRIEDVDRTVVYVGHVQRMSCFIQVDNGSQSNRDTGSAALKHGAAEKDNLPGDLRAPCRVSCVTATNINNSNRVTVSSSKRGEQCPMSGIEYQVSGIWSP